ncbi:hypothetical protein BC628DRAFT_1036093 [Trametes gibbosa]|nr:hypothetical protein BC628DRAFT_1036093 [Trametes gibbosa]
MSATLVSGCIIFLITTFRDHSHLRIDTGTYCDETHDPALNRRAGNSILTRTPAVPLVPSALGRTRLPLRTGRSRDGTFLLLRHSRRPGPSWRVHQRSSLEREGLRASQEGLRARLIKLDKVGGIGGVEPTCEGESHKRRLSHNESHCAP